MAAYRSRVVMALGPGIVAGVVILLTVGLLSVLVEAQSPSQVFLTGIRVQGYAQGGLAYYTYRGATYSLDDPYQAATHTAPEPVTVYLRRDNPTDGSLARVDSVTRWVDGFLVLSWFIAAAALALVGYLRRRGRRRRPPVTPLA